MNASDPRRIQLATSWTIGSQIGDPSGFGEVFEATNEEGMVAALKLVPIAPGASRELLFVDLGDVPNIVPVIEWGTTSTHYVLVMPRAERSLRASIAEQGGAFSAEEAVAVFRDVVQALVAIHGRVVHRDIKPENILLLDGAWCLGDFGIARYLEAATSSETHKFAMTAAYAAPERWRFERATTASDVYAVGIVGHELLAGQLPFLGPDWDDFRAQHLTASPPAIPGLQPTLASMLTECLVKAPEARPTPKNLAARLDRIFAPASAAALSLQEASQRAAIERFEHEAAASAVRTEADRRDRLYTAAKQILTHISDRLQELVRENAPEAAPQARSAADWWSLNLGSATLGMDPPLPSPPSWGGFAPAFEVIAHATIAVLIPRDRNDFEGRSHSLWYCDAQEPGVFRWYETAFMISPMIARQFYHRPAAMKPGEDAGKALWQGIAEYQVAYPFTPIDQGAEVGFFERWLGWFAVAAVGKFSAPTTLPEMKTDGSWRRS